ncbi:MAG: glycoside hydrolase family 3 C-terminal domain-containing protein, partial [Muribaculaceae bacterium]|nr:glycoside hydrolase family 3 C-terminal domain-containing protein [Muribaculaceae bacterium]
MKKRIRLMCAASLALAASNINVEANTPSIPQDPQMENRITELLGKMTLEEKIGQMTQLTLDVLGGKYEPDTRPDMKIPKERLDDVIGRHKVGSILNVADVALTPQQWYEIVSQLQTVSMKEIGIPCIYGLDMNHGANYTIGATLFPQNINMGATFNTSLAKRGGEITAYETRASDVPWTFNPTVDLSRNPLWPRVYENYGEDAYLNAAMGTAAVSGMQGPDPNHIDRYHIAANLKHFMGYGSPVSGRDRTHSSIGEMEMREKHFAPYYKAITEGKALSIMVNSTTNNGVPFHANARYLNRWLKQELNWDGLIVTDWADINNLWNREYVAHDKKEAIAMAINAGIDMAMEPYDTDFCTLLKECVEEGLVPMDRINDACARVLRMKMRLGLFETPNTCITDYPLFGSKEFAKAATDAAIESMVLLKNDDALLPIANGKKILIAGPNANSMRALNGGWTYTWQGQRTDEIAKDHNTILEAMQKRFGKENIIYAPGVTYAPHDWNDWGKENAPDFDSAVKAAADADIIMVCIGETSYCETPGNTNDLHLSANQRERVQRLAATGKPLM